MCAKYKNKKQERIGKKRKIGSSDYSNEKVGRMCVIVYVYKVVDFLLKKASDIGT